MRASASSSTPLVTVLLAVLVRREPVRPWQLAAIALAGAAVAVDAFAYGKVPWLALILALGGGLYGLFKKQANAGALESLALETAVVAPFALIFLIVDAAAGHSTCAPSPHAPPGSPDPFRQVRLAPKRRENGSPAALRPVSARLV